MKQLIIILASIGLLYSCSKEKTKEQANWTKDSTEIAKRRNYINNPTNSTSIQWLDSVYVELDTVKQGKLLNLSWRFKNNGNKPLVIANATSSCECTNIDKPKKAIAPEKTGVINASFDSKGMLGWQRKDVYILLNNKSNIVQTLSFAVYVVK
jgi:hypothetical protein